MTDKSQAAKQLFTLEKAKAELAGLALLRLSEDSTERAMYWSIFKQSTKSAVAALIRFGMQSGQTRSVAHRIRNWESDDRMFKYLLHARNAEIHAEKHGDAIPNPVNNAEMKIGMNGVSIGDGIHVSMNNCEIDGLPINGTFGVVGGKMIINSLTRVPIGFKPKQILMQSVRDDSGNLYEFPFDLVAKGDLPEQFAVRHVLERLNAWKSELQA